MADNDEHLTAVFRDFIKLIKNNISSNLTILTTSEIAEVPDTPGVALSEPALSWNMQKTQKDKTSVQNEEDGTYKEYEPPKAFDVECEIMIITKSTPELMNMTQKAMIFFDKNSQATLDGVDYPINLVSQFSTTSKPNLTNFHIVTGQVQIEGVLIESGDYEDGYLVQQVNWTYQNKRSGAEETKSFDEGGKL